MRTAPPPIPGSFNPPDQQGWQDSSQGLQSVRSAIERSTSGASGRHDLWSAFLTTVNARTVAEIGVHEGEFAAAMLDRCPRIERYYLVDPWRRLSDWNKPLNAADAVCDGRFRKARERTEFAAEKRVLLRGTTLEMESAIEPASLDFVYIDGDHTLRGISTDLIALLPKVREGGWIAGDDFCPSIWQHGPKFEPTLVFPMAVHFAEAMRMPIFALPFGQFLIWKATGQGFRFVDPGGQYSDLALRRQLGASAACRLRGSRLRKSLLNRLNSGRRRVGRFTRTLFR